MTNDIYFYYAEQENGFLSNFYPCTIRLDGYAWPSSEHYYQAQKFTDNKYKYWILHAPTAHDAFKATRFVKPERIRSDWEKVRVGVMETVVKAKFTQNHELEEKLLSFGKDAVFHEASPVDSFWGIGADGKGLNMLGNILTKYKNDRLDFYNGDWLM